MDKTVLDYPLPNRWQKLDRYMGPTGACYRDTKTGMMIIETTAPQDDGKEWHHLSMSYRDHLPTYEEMTLLKAVFIGTAYRSLFIFAEASQHVNIHEYCLHLWTCLDERGDGLPDFGRFGTI